MAVITAQEIEALARECRLALGPEELGRGRAYLEAIIGLLDTLQAVDVAVVSPYVAAEIVDALHDPPGPPPPREDLPAPTPRPAVGPFMAASCADEPASMSTWTAWETADRVRRGEVSALAVTRAALARIAAIDPHLRAWVRLDERGALAGARCVDAARARGEALGPLAGVPTGLKDNFVTAGLETTAGSRILQGWIPPEDGAHAARLRAAGAVILGKLALDEFGMGSSNENTPFAAVRNPWAPDFVPGGSSGGSAAAVASRTVCFSLGSDSGGSIRQPASLCGLVGLKPTYGRVSRSGLVAFVSSLDQAGPLTRDVRDAALVLGCLAGHDPMDMNTIRAPVPDYLAEVARGQTEGLAGLRIGVHHEALALPGLDPAVRACFEAALAQLTAAGATLHEVSLPHFRHAVPTYYALASALTTSNLARFDGTRDGRNMIGEDFDRRCTATRSRGFGEEVRRRLLLGTHVLRSGAAYYERATRVQTLIARDYAAVFERCDLLASPTTRLPGFRLGERVHDPVAMYLSDIFVVGANLAGLPAISVPAGFSPATTARPRLPVGLHLVAPLLGEPTLLRAAAAHEARTTWHLEVPPGAAR
jgi:aspartyl-tRNA(Asn)/glutamyl-tRNA(Gln) amidotransferase subunit A